MYGCSVPRALARRDGTCPSAPAMAVRLDVPPSVAGPAVPPRDRYHRGGPVGPFIASRRAHGFLPGVPAPQMVVGTTRSWRRTGVLRVLCRSAVRVLEVRRPPGTGGFAFEDDLRIAGHHELASLWQRLLCGVRFPLVSALRSR